MRINGISVHPSVTVEIVMEAVERRMNSLDNPGFCICCGVENGGCEPDARRYECDACGEMAVYGAEEILFRFM